MSALMPKDIGSRLVFPDRPAAHPDFVRSKIVRNGTFVWLYHKTN
jgi:hypothetical protein